ncbi:MAG TPA: hypothetical protein ENI35_03015 [Candidatus Desulfofervidus auxilii]|uniref:Uncharacterized protein n=1 Tax=Desulfofervidus auxilii TaxID=1621989 RepID=A0A7C1ZN05_DESA2|nr:hypothetical protein [Candidatus Desulfofervidus auxilii]
MQKWHIQTNCPQCGAPVCLKETQRVLNCEYCKTRLYLFSQPFFCYMFSPKDPEAQVLFIPFWRIKGITFSLKMPPKIEAKIIDKTLMAIDIPLAFTSLGVRPQAVNLEFANVEKRGIFLSPQMGFKEVFHKLKEKPTDKDGVPEKIYNINTFGDKIFHYIQRKINKNIKKGMKEASVKIVFSDFLGEAVSLIYFPLIIEKNNQRVILKDGLSGQNIGNLTKEGLNCLKKKRISKLPTLQFLPLICPQCGWDMPCNDEAWAVFCHHCGQGWYVSQNKFKKLDYKTAKTEQEVFYLPFWRINATVPDFSLYTQADLIRFSNLPKIIKDHHKKSPFHIYVPAFKINPRQFLHMAKSITLAQPDYSYLHQPVSNAHHVLLPPTEALNSVKLVIASIGTLKKHFFPKLPRIKPKIDKITLVFLPFTQKGIDLVLLYQAMNISIPANALKWGDFL